MEPPRPRRSAFCPTVSMRRGFRLSQRARVIRRRTGLPDWGTQRLWAKSRCLRRFDPCDRDSVYRPPTVPKAHPRATMHIRPVRPRVRCFRRHSLGVAQRNSKCLTGGSLAASETASRATRSSASMRICDRRFFKTQAGGCGTTSATSSAQPDWARSRRLRRRSARNESS